MEVLAQSADVSLSHLPTFCGRSHRPRRSPLPFLEQGQTMQHCCKKIVKNSVDYINIPIPLRYYQDTNYLTTGGTKKLNVTNAVKPEQTASSGRDVTPVDAAVSLFIVITPRWEARPPLTVQISQQPTKQYKGVICFQIAVNTYIAKFYFCNVTHFLIWWYERILDEHPKDDEILCLEAW